MNGQRKFRVDKLRKLLGLVERRLARQTLPAAEILIQEPAAVTYACPATSGDYRPISVGQNWGAKNQWSYFCANLKVPAHWQGGAVEFRLRHDAKFLEPFISCFLEAAGPEGQVFINGRRAGAIDREHHSIRHSFTQGVNYAIQAVFFAGRVQCRHELAEFGLAWIDTPTEKLYHDLRVTLDVIDQLDESSPVREKLIWAVDAAISAIDMRGVIEVEVLVDPRADKSSDPFYGSLAGAQTIFDQALSAINDQGERAGLVVVGHAHIDLAWLWPIAQTRHKCVRTFSTQCRLLEQYGKWVYNQSSPQAYQWVEQDAPDLFEKIRGHIAAGRWDADGAMWCEADTNITGGESLVRQLLYGKKYFKEKLGVDSRVLWLPDVFGYSGALPQLLKLAGVDSFVTSKISWSQYNRFPHDTFRWRGIDGTEVPVHFITTPCKGSWFLTYNALLNAEEVKGAWSEYRQKPLQLDPIMSFGYGDGGGGPTALMLETADRLDRIPAGGQLPRIKHQKVGELMKRVADRAADLPVWDGELYLEYHRGTYTTQGWLKRANRKNEIRLHNAEWLGSLASLHGFKLDKSVLDTMWEDLLLCQFHDILPGSSCGEVYYDEVRPMMDRIAQKADALVTQATDAIVAKIDTSKLKQPVVLFNTLSWDRREPVVLPDGTMRDDITVPAGGWTVIDAAAKLTSRKAVELSISAEGCELENRYWKLSLDQQGRIIGLYDKNKARQVLKPGSLGNQWQVFEDRPIANDAWDIDYYYQAHPLPGPQCMSMKVVQQDDILAAIEVDWELPSNVSGKQSTISQRIIIYGNNPRIDFQTTADWHEHHQLLKVAFPVDVRATEATYETQFGHLGRPTHRNTSWDLARFESCAHRFVDLSEHGYGVSLMNDCKYGHDIHEGIIRLTCIKCPQSPDTLADQGRHEFVYSLLPHAGTFQDAGVVRAAAELNNPLIARAAKSAVKSSAGSVSATYRFVDCDSKAVVLDTVKPAEDGDGIILRLYESHGSHAKATLTFTLVPKAVEHVNLLEKPSKEDSGLTHKNEMISVALRPFQIITLRLS